MAELATESVELGTDATTTGSLAVLRLRHFTRDAPLAAPDFHLEARHLLVESDHTDTYAQQVVISPGTQTTPIHSGPGTLSGTTNRINHNLWITAIDAATIQAEGPARLARSEAESETWEPMVNHARGQSTTNTTHTATWGTGQDAVATITGNLQLRLWEWDALLEADGHRKNLTSGVQGPASSAGVGGADELIVTAIDAVLTIPLTPTTYALYLRAIDADAESLRFQNADGTLAGLTGPIRGDLHLTGDLSLNVTTDTEAQLTAAVSGRVQRAALDGEPLAIATPRAAPAGAPPVVPFAFIAVALIVLAALLALRRRGASMEAVQEHTSVPSRVAASVGDVEAERSVLRVVRRHPGVTVRRLQDRVGVSKERCAAAVQVLLARGELVRRGTEARWHIFLPDPGLDETWVQVAALQDPNLRLLYDVVREHGEAEQRVVVAAASTRWDWPASTTKARLRRLAEAGLVRVTKSVPATRSVPRGTVFVTSAPAPATEGN